MIAAPIADVMWSYPGAMSVANGPEGVEGRLLAEFLFQPHVLHDLVHWNVSGSLDHHLHTMGFRNPGQLPEGAEFGELGRVVGVGDGAGPKPVAEREGDVVALQDLAELVEMRVEKRLLVMGQTSTPP